MSTDGPGAAELFGMCAALVMRDLVYATGAIR